MKIAFDLDGVAWKHRFFFSELAKAMKARGHNIGILTAHHHEKSVDEDYYLWRAKEFPPLDFYLARIGMKEHNMLIGEWKRKMIIKHHIDVLFDDFGGNNPDIEDTFFEKEVNAIIFKVIGDEE